MGNKIEVIPGEKYGKLTIIKEVEPRTYPSGKKMRRVLVSCSCNGKEKEVSLSSLRSGAITSCGCSRKKEVKPGDRYGRLTVIKEVEPYIPNCGKSQRRFLCRCDCDGKEIKVILNNLRNGTTKSCGCYSKENMSKRQKKFNKYVFNEDGSVTGYTLKGEEFFFDKDYYEDFKQYCWRKEKFGYIVTTDNKTGKELRMHRMVANCPDDKIVDHIDHNTVNNRSTNLRICTQLENCKNYGMKSNNSSGFNGVMWNKRNKKWIASITVNYKKIYLGSFSNKQDAIEARLKAELELFGEYSPNYEKLTQQQSDQ